MVELSSETTALTFAACNPLSAIVCCLPHIPPFGLTASRTCSNFALVITKHPYSWSFGSTPNKSPVLCRTPIPSRLSDHVFPASRIAIVFLFCAFSRVFVAFLLDSRYFQPMLLSVSKPWNQPDSRDHFSRDSCVWHDKWHNNGTIILRPKIDSTRTAGIISTEFPKDSAHEKNVNWHVNQRLAVTCRRLSTKLQNQLFCLFVPPCGWHPWTRAHRLAPVQT